MLAIDQVLHQGRYRIINSFSQDSTGGMYEAYDTVSNTNVVLRESIGNLGKVATSTQIEAVNLAFVGGAKILTEIKHESLVSVHDYFADIDRQYLVLESVASSDLAKFLKPDEKRPALADMLSWADQLLDALQYLHTRHTPIIHGDVRPENVKLTSHSKVKLLTPCAHSDGTSDIITLAPIRSTEDSGVNYRPLEQLWGGLDALSQRVILNHYDEESERWLLQSLSAATDLYSLAATLYSVMTGSVPPDALDRSIAALEGKPDPLQNLADLNADIPTEISDMIMKAMSIRREDRYYSAVIFRQILRTAATRAKVTRSDEHGAEVTDVKPLTETDLGAIPQIPIIIAAPVEKIDLDIKALAIDQLEERQIEPDAEIVNEINPPLLELKPVGTQAETDDDSFDLLEIPALPLVKKYVTSEAVEYKTEHIVANFEEPTRSKSKFSLPLIGVAVVMVAAAVFGVLKFTSSNAPATTTSVAAQQASVPPPTEVKPPVADEHNATEPTQSGAADQPQNASVTETVTRENKPVQLNAAPEKAKKPVAAAPAKTPAPKKKVTVDDLINDH